MQSKIITVFTFILTFGMLNIYGGASLNGYLDYYGHLLPTIYDQELHNLNFTTLSQKKVSSKLEDFRNSNLTQSTRKISFQAKKFKMDDLAVVLLTDKLANSITRDTEINEQVFIKLYCLRI